MLHLKNINKIYHGYSVMKAASLSVKTQLAIIMFAYIVFAAVFGYAYRYALNPDGLSLLRLAGYIAEGNFQWSVTRAWSPLITWLIAPFLFIGFDGLTASRVAIALCGAGMLLSSWFLSLRFDLSQNMRLVALLVAALLISFWTIQVISADVLLAALILLYIYFVTDPEVLNNRKIAFCCGIVGGVSYLSHHYAFPFFWVHFPLLLLIRGHIDRDKEGVSLKRVLASWVIGIAGFLIIASIWIGVVSVKYGQFTISSKGPIAHASVGPKDKGHPFFAGGLYKPRDSYAIHVFEDPSEVKFKTWSPFESKEYFFYQLKLIKDNIVSILNHFVKMSPFFTYAFMVGVLALIPIVILLNKLNKKKRFLYAWFILTFCVYCSGFLLITARSPRRFYSIMIIFLFIAFHFLEELINAFRDSLSGKRKKIMTIYLLMIFVSAFALKPGVILIKSLKNIIAVDQVNPYREIVGQISDIQFPSPYAIIRSAQKPHTDIYIAYYLKKQLLGSPLSKDIEGITKELMDADARALLVFDSPESVQKLKSDIRYVHLAYRGLQKDIRYLNAVNIEQDNIKGWDEEVNVFILK